MNMSLAPNRLIAQPSALVGNNSKQQHALPKYLAMLFASHIHRNTINRIGAIAARGKQAIADRFEAP